MLRPAAGSASRQGRQALTAFISVLALISFPLSARADAETGWQGQSVSSYVPVDPENYVEFENTLTLTFDGQASAREETTDSRGKREGHWQQVAVATWTYKYVTKHSNPDVPDPDFHAGCREQRQADWSGTADVALHLFEDDTRVSWPNEPAGGALMRIGILEDDLRLPRMTPMPRIEIEMSECQDAAANGTSSIEYNEGRGHPLGEVVFAPDAPTPSYTEHINSTGTQGEATGYFEVSRDVQLDYTSILSVSPDPIFACSDGTNNDFDGLVDYPLDPGCTGAYDDSELGTAACDNGLDDDGDGGFDWPADTACENGLDDTERACHRASLSKDWLGIAQGDMISPTKPDASYGLAIRWCTIPGESTRLESDPTVRVEENRGGGKLDAFGRFLESVSIEVNQQWVPNKSQKVKSEALPGGGMRVTAATGHFEVCVGLGGAIYGVSKRAFKLLPKKARKRLVKRLKHSAKNEIEQAYYRRYTDIKEDLIGKKNPKTGRDYTPQARKNEAERIAGRHRRAQYWLLDFFTGELIDKLGFKKCLRAWTPKITATIAVDGSATMIETGYIRGWLWIVLQPKHPWTALAVRGGT